ncbi:hypothetical protein CR970_00455 [Candidatus Saccharibacteria bacterium]|nr:MAG: hypothetical protein CR970_00455 [Candidatus Saccharibacteria bacterium]
MVFGERQVRDVLTPRRVVHAVDADSTIGPVLLDELHRSGFSRFPVRESGTDKIVGVLYLRDVRGGKTSGQVRDIMHPSEVCYVHEEQTLTEALGIILRLRRHMLIVVNSFEEYVGVVTIEDLMEQIVDGPLVDEFDRYDDMRAVAAKMAAKDHEKHTKLQEKAAKTKKADA